MPIIELRPQPGPQEAFLSCPADIAIYGGAAGGGKTYALLLEPLRHVGRRGFNAVIFRRESEQIRNDGALWDESLKLYSGLGASPREQHLDWRFKSGAAISFAGLQLESDVYKWQGAQICLLGFDELTHFNESQFFYMLSRNRSTCGVRPYIRATCNPDPSSWVYKFIEAWVNPSHPDPAASGEIRAFVREVGAIRWVPVGTPNSKTVTFIHASIHDNKKLIEADPGYLDNLNALPEVEKRRLLYGDWTAVADGNFFRRSDFQLIDPSDCPAFVDWTIGWDTALTAKTVNDYSSWCRLAMDVNQNLYVWDWGAIRLEAPDLQKFMLAKQIRHNSQQSNCYAAIEPKANGQSMMQFLVRDFGAAKNSILAQKLISQAKFVSGSKAARAAGPATVGRAGKLFIVRQNFIETGFEAHDQLGYEECINLCLQFVGDEDSKGPHDDPVDSLSVAFHEGRVSETKIMMPNFYRSTQSIGIGG